MWQRIPNGRDDWRFSPPAGAGATTGILWAAGSVGHAASVPAWWAWPASAAVLVACAAAWRGRHLSRLSLTLRAGLWAAGTVWLWQALAVSPWRPGMLAALAIGTVAAVLAAPALSRADQRAETTAEALEEVKQRDRQGAEWEGYLRTAGISGATVRNIEPWEPVEIRGEQVIPGFTLDVDTGGATLDTVAGVTGRLAALAKLPAGAGVEVTPGVDQSRALLLVATVDTLSEDLAWKHGPESSINSDIELGQHRNGAPVLVNVRERTMLLCGPKGRGKSTTLHGITGRALEQNDHLLIGIDLSGGDFVRPWMAPWLAGETDRPAFDWVAGDVEEAILAATAALDIGRARKGMSASARQAADTMLTPLSPSFPRITIIMDEGEMAGGQDAGPRERELGRILLAIVKECRNSGVDVLFCSLRPVGTSLLGGTDLRAQTRVKLMTGCDDVAEAGYMFGTHRGLALADTAKPGRLWISVDGADPRPYVAPNMTPSIIREIAIRTDKWRPALDDASAAIAGPAYATRWERAGWLHETGTTTSAGGSVLLAPPPTPQPIGSGDGSDSGPGDLASAVADLDASIAALRADNAAAGSPPEPPADPDADVLAGIAAATTAATGDRRGLALALLYDAGPGGISAGPLQLRLARALAEAGDATAPTARQTVSAWLAAEHAAGRVWKRTGPKGIYVHGDWPRPSDAEDSDTGSGG